MPEPKYRSIAAVLRARIVGGEWSAGERLPSQRELAGSFGVTLMTLRQALSALEADGLVRAERGRGTFVADRPVEVSLSNLSSFADQLARDGVALDTEVLDVTHVDEAPADVAAALSCDMPLRRIRRLRRIDGRPVSLQSSWFEAAIPVDRGLGESLYAAIEEATGRAVTEAHERLTAVALTPEAAALLDARVGGPAIRSIRTSLDQFGRAFLHDDALLVGGRSSITAHRTSSRLDLRYGVMTDLPMF